LRDETHLDVELIKLAGRAVGARVLVTEARRDLKISIEARNHDQLLELLRRLRQRVELAGMQARRHQIVASTLRTRGGENRSLELEKALLEHAPAQRLDNGAALHEVAMKTFTTQIKEPVPEPDVLRIFLIAEHRHRQFGGRPQHFDVV